MNEEVSSEWITYKQAQALTGLSRTSLWRIICAGDGEVEAARVGRAIRINRASLTAYMKRSAATPPRRAR